MTERPVRLVLTDDLHRSRLTVAFRLLLAIPHLIWYALWSVAAIVVAVVAWFAGLFRASLPEGLHGFLSAYTRYTTQLFAYLSLTANPYPGFVGDRGYPVDLEIDPPRRQRRLTIAFRLLIAVPALILAAIFIGLGGGDPQPNAEVEWKTVSIGGIVWTVAFLGWFVCLVRGRMPLGFRNLNAYGLRFNAEALAYVFLLTERYPDADPRAPAGAGEAPPHPIRLDVDEDLRRSRLTVFFRLFLALPHLVWLLLWTVVAFVAAIANWIVTLVRGMPATSLHRFLSAYVRYGAHVSAYLFLIANRFPAFTGDVDYAVRVSIDEPRRQNRWVTGFRAVLGIPAALVSGALNGLLFVAGVFGWFAALATGRMPQSLRNAGAYAIRYSVQNSAYWSLLTDRYPFSGPPAATAPVPAADVAP